MALPPPPPPPCDDHAHWAGTIAGHTCSIGPADSRMSRQNCAYFGRTLHAGLFHMVCGNCYNLSWAARGVYNDMVSCFPIGTPTGAADPASGIAASGVAWPGPPPVPHMPRFTEFWTRLCSVCERIEQDKFEEAMATFIPGVFPPPAPGRTDPVHMWDYPLNTCGYLMQIGWPANVPVPPNPPGPMAAPGVIGQPAVAPVRIAAPFKLCRTSHDITALNIGARKVLNDTWLRNLSRTADGRLCLASNRTKNRRDSPASSTHRACRCGADVDTMAHPPEVLQCMACQGLRCLIRKNDP